jgi:formylglycine-generating enzyme required for sulfatase activity
LTGSGAGYWGLVGKRLANLHGSILRPVPSPYPPTPKPIMHCERCNVDFSEGLRYCKWCGGPLADRPRVTSELHTCPSCSAAVQPGWTFCKSCGERLRASTSEPASAACPQCGAPAAPGALNCVRCGQNLTGGQAPLTSSSESAETSLIAACSSCGERLDTGSLYCKGCGSAVYTEQTEIGGSSMLCGACNSHSPLGSRVCRFCGTPFAQASRTVAEFPAAALTVKQMVPTLPDLDERSSEQTPPDTPEQQPWDESDAKTATFIGAERAAKGTGETNLLPGTAGSRSEQQAPTAVMHMGRITGPVEEQSDERGQPSIPSGELRHVPATGTGVEGTTIIGDEPTVQLSEEPRRPTTSDFGSDSVASPVGSESKTAVFVSPSQETPPTPREEVSREEMGTRQFTPAQPSPEPEPTREFQPIVKTPTAEQSALTGQITSTPQWTGVAPIEPVAIPEPPQSEWQIQPDAQLASQPLPRNRTGLVVSVVVGVLILLGAAGLFAWFLFGRAKPAPRITPRVAVEQPVTTEPPITPPEKPSAPAVPQGMVAVAAGRYTIGRDGGDADPLEQPEHKIDLAAFFIDRSEVTNAAYKNFVEATGHQPPSNWTGTKFPEGRDDFPVTGVTWQDAADYAGWAGKRLPTEAEWEAAARGLDGRIYPWGNGFRSGVANIGSKPDKPTPEQYPAGIRQIGRYPEGASPSGAVDMIGNAWEWVADEIKAYPGNTESKLDLEPGSTYRVIRGGAYDGGAKNDATYRGYLDGNRPYPKVGFRCAKDAK